MNIYQKWIKKIKGDDSVDNIEEVLEDFLEYNYDSFEETEIFDFSISSFKDWIVKKHPELITDEITLDSEDEDLFFDITENDLSVMAQIYAEYLVDLNNVDYLIEVFEDLDYLEKEESYEGDADEYY